MSFGSNASRRPGAPSFVPVCAALALALGAGALSVSAASAAPARSGQAVAPAASPTVSVTIVRNPVSTLQIYPRAISNNGYVVGRFETEYVNPDEVRIEHAFVWRNGTFTHIPALGGEGATATAFAVNSNGDVVGESEIAPFGPYHAFLWKNATQELIDLGAILGTAESTALDINDAGQVVGEMGDREFGHAFVWSEATGVVDLGQGRAQAINASGKIAGRVWSESNDFQLQQRAAIWQNGQLTVLPNFGGELDSDSALDINDNGTVVGRSKAADGFLHAFLWKGGALTDLGAFLQIGPAEARSINNRDQVVGNADYKPFLWENGRMTAIDDRLVNRIPEFVFDAYSINDAGQIACHALSPSETISTYVIALVNFNGGSTPPPAGNVDLTADWTPATRKVKGTGKKLTATITSSLTVRNTGSATSGKFVVKYYLSSTPDLSGVVAPVGSSKMNPLKAGAVKTLKYSVSLKGPLAEAASGAYVLAVVDDGDKVAETDETNNLKAVQIP